MSDPKKPNPGQPAFLPRTWKAEPEPVEEPKPASESKKSKKKAAQGAEAERKPSKKKKKASEPETSEAGGSKLEETPLLDTYQARQRIRYILGGVISLVAVIGLFVVVKIFQPSSPKVDPAADRKDSRAVTDPKESNEREAAALVENARQRDKLGQGEAAIKLLQKVTRNFEGTEAAKVAKAALDREQRNRPLFAVEDPKNPSGPRSPAPTNPNSPGGSGANPGPVVAVASAPSAPTPPPPAVKPAEVVARPLPNGFHAQVAAGLHPTGWPRRITCDRDDAVMILVPAGEFLMGREDGDPSERPSHRVKLSTYYVDQHEVTNRQYQAYLKETGRPTETVPAERLELPVVGLNAREARAYCYWANRRLPTEAQWEMAARSEDGRVSYGIDKEDLRGDSSPRTLQPVMASAADRSPFGGFDFAANALEWTQDYYDPRYYNQVRGLAVDPTGPTQSRINPPQLTIKGGSKLGFLTWREGAKIEARSPQLGFRGVLPVEASAAPAASTQPGSTGPPSAGGLIPF